MAKSLPEPILKAARPINRRRLYLRYQRFLRSVGTDIRRFLVIGTIPKSGLHYMLFLLANYVRLLDGSANGPVKGTEMDAMFPNSSCYQTLDITSHHDQTSSLKLIGLDDLVGTSSVYWNYWDRSRVVHLYRNPLDFAVSRFFDYESRKSTIGTYPGPVETLEGDLDSYVKSYLSYREAAGAGDTNVLRISYEDLVSYPLPCFRIILRWLGVDPDPSLTETAVRYSSRETLRRLEDAGHPVETTPDFVGKFFVRDGGIGQWKQHFEISDVQRVRQRLSLSGIKLEDFVLEA